MDSAAMDVADDAGRLREKVFDDLVHRAQRDLALRLLSHVAEFSAAKRQVEEESEKQKPGEVHKDAEVAAATENVKEEAANALETAFVKELEQRCNEGELTDADAEHELMAYNVGLSIAAEQRAVKDGPGVHEAVDEEAGFVVEALYWHHPFHSQRFDPAIVHPPLGGDVHDAFMGIAAIWRKRCEHYKGDKWRSVRDVLRLAGSGLFFIHEEYGVVDASSAPTVMLRCIDDDADAVTLVVAVEATTTLRDWLLNMQVMLAPPPPALGLPETALIHSGWARIAADLVEGGAIFDKVDRHRLEGKPLRVVWTGHSVGGAIATLLAAAFACRASLEARAIAVKAAAHVARGDDSTDTIRAPVEDRSVLVTMGTPRVGDAATQAMFKALTTHTSMVSEGDVVPQLPPGPFLRRRFPTAGRFLGGDAVRQAYAPALADHHWLLLRAPIDKVVVAGAAAQSSGRVCLSPMQVARNHSLRRYFEAFVNFYDFETWPAEEAAAQ